MSASRERPILFAGRLVRAILDGRKTQTRRIVGDVNAHPDAWASVSLGSLSFMAKHTARGKFGATFTSHRDAIEAGSIHVCPVSCPYGVPGDRLWVRETWLYVGPGSGSEIDGPIEQARRCNQKPENVWYRADGERDLRWRPSIFMPRWASRLTLEVTEIRVQRLQDITDEDVIAEGVVVPESSGNSLRDWFACGWDELNEERAPWSSNPWVWVINFRRL